jgi:Carboxypeptidase regulatory-like domain/TonB dependent receptor-like, beta-barrel
MVSRKPKQLGVQANQFWRSKKRNRYLAVLALCLTFATAAWAQKDTGSIVGTVKDSTGAVVPDAKVTVTDTEMGINFVTSTNSSGEYVASPLKIGRYKVTVTKEGFKTLVLGPMDLQVQQRLAVDATLQVGQVTQEVQVTGQAALLETQTSELGQVVNNRQVVNLPLNGRNFAQLALLTAGTAPSEPGARDEGGYGFSSNGGRSLQNNFLLDGVDNNSNLTDLLNETNYVIQPSVDAIQEFKVQTNAYSAEFGRGNGAIVNVTLKSGTNSLHGDAYEFLRNDSLDGRNFFDATRPPYRQNQFGATLGGPIDLPHIYDGHNRTFFFVDYEGLRVREAQTQTATVPTLDQRNGDFSSQIDYTSPTGVNDCNGHPTYVGEIFNSRLAQVVTPASGNNPAILCGVPFGYNASSQPLNVIPTGTMDPLAATLAALYPDPNSNNSAYNYLANPVLKQDRNNFDVRVDHRFSDKDTSFYRFSFEDQPSSIPPTFPNTLADGGGFFSGVEDNAYRSFALSETHIFSPSLVNEFRFGYNRIHAQRFQFNYNTNVSAEVGFPGVPFAPDNGGLPQLTFSDVYTLGSPTYLPSLEIQNTFSYSDNLTWIKGKHSIKFGTEIRPEEFTIFQPAEPRGSLDFGPGFTDNAGDPGTGGSGFASFLLGISDGGGITNLHNVDYLRKVYAFYVQDDYRLTPKLTLNLGLRYELFGTVKEKFNAQGTYDLATQTLLIPKGDTQTLTPTLAAEIPLSATATPGLVNPDTNNYAPRIGFAYQATPKTVIRGGYGIFYGGEENGPYSNPSQGFNPPFFVTQSFNTPCGAASANPALASQGLDCSIPGLSVLANGFPANSLTDPNTPQLFTLDPKIVTPYVHQWHLSVQRELPGNTLFEATYGGSKGTKLYTFFNGNQAAPSTDPNAAYAPRRPIPSIDSGISLFNSTGNSDYNSLQLRVEKRYSNGLAFMAAYTWSHSLDNASNANLGAQNNDGFRWTAHPEWEYGNSDFDIRNRLVLNYQYDLPFGHGKKFLASAGGALNQVVGGWQLAGITTISSGNWFTITTTGVPGANSDGQQRPDQIGNPNGTPCVPGTWFNTCAFTDPQLGSFGTAGRNTLQGPGYQEWDLSVFKTFRTSENTHLEFRSEFFNLPNHANLLLAKSGPQNSINTTTMNTPQFGYLTAARAPRQIQFALKFFF